MKICNFFFVGNVRFFFKISFSTQSCVSLVKKNVKFFCLAGKFKKMSTHSQTAIAVIFQKN